MDEDAEALESGEAVHRMAEAFAGVIEGETTGLLAVAREEREFDWDAFPTVWYRIVRRVVFGRGARDGHDMADMLARLRATGNWAFLHPGPSAFCNASTRGWTSISHALKPARWRR
jgi:hypothetical protein